MIEKISYEAALRACLLDFIVMVGNEIAYHQTGKHAGEPMRNCIGQWASLVRDAHNLVLQAPAAAVCDRCGGSLGIGESGLCAQCAAHTDPR